VAVEARVDESQLSIVLAPLFAPLTPEVERRLIRTVVDRFEQERLEFEGPESFGTAAGPARSLRWSLWTEARLAFVFIPVCGERITLMAIVYSQRAEVMSEARRWLQSLRFDVASPACRFALEDGP
jgi:hypothetical protein